MDAITLLRDDHTMLRELTQQFADTAEKAVETRKKLLKRIEMELKAHTTIEEELFYPALLDASDDIKDARMVAEGIEEHRAADKKVIPDLHKADESSIAYSGEAKVLKDYIFHHLKEEEEEMFPRVRELIGRKELQELGEKMLARKKELLGELA
ncbi:MAG: hemerythrin domain-containing protein [Hyphomonadaceae bacterium]|nr:hemerythrin domain-containing protein [Hyphomonadaceae bacterium]